MDDFTYVIERFDVSGDCEKLIQRAELVRHGDDLMCLVQGGEERILGDTDVASAIAKEPVLSEVRANQVTRITAAGRPYEALPFILQIPGDLDDFDSAQWSSILADDHTTDMNEEQRAFRVAYVNGRRWCAFATVNGGSRMLREARLWPSVLFEPRWGNLFIYDNEREDTFKIGPMTERAVVVSHQPDDYTYQSDDYISPEVVDLWRRTPGADSDAFLVVEWLLNWVPKQLGLPDDAHKQLLAQLLIEVAVHGRSKVSLPVSYLAAGNESGSLGGGDAVWKLELDLSAEAMTQLAVLVAERSPQMANIVTAAHDPDSAQARLRRSAIENLGQWALDLEKQVIPKIISDDADQDEDDSDEDDPNAPWNHDPAELLPLVIEPGRIPLRFWRSDFNGGWVLYDFVFTWSGGQEADWYYDISMENDGLSVMSSAPTSGVATWKNRRDVQITYSCAEFDLDDTATLDYVAPVADSLTTPSAWVNLGSKIAGFIDGLIE